MREEYNIVVIDRPTLVSLMAVAVGFYVGTDKNSTPAVNGKRRIQDTYPLLSSTISYPDSINTVGMLPLCFGPHKDPLSPSLHQRISFERKGVQYYFLNALKQ